MAAWLATELSDFCALFTAKQTVALPSRYYTQARWQDIGAYQESKLERANVDCRWDAQRPYKIACFARDAHRSCCLADAQANCPLKAGANTYAEKKYVSDAHACCHARIVLEAIAAECSSGCRRRSNQWRCSDEMSRIASWHYSCERCKSSCTHCMPMPREALHCCMLEQCRRRSAKGKLATLGLEDDGPYHREDTARLA